MNVSILKTSFQGRRSDDIQSVISKLFILKSIDYPEDLVLDYPDDYMTPYQTTMLLTELKRCGVKNVYIKTASMYVYKRYIDGYKTEFDINKHYEMTISLYIM